MTSPAIELLREEMAAHEAKLAKPTEGLRNYSRLADDQQQERDMREASDAVQTKRAEQVKAIGTVREALIALEKTEYPAVPKVRAAGELLAKFKRNLDELQAAYDDLEIPSDVAGGKVTLGANDED